MVTQEEKRERKRESMKIKRLKKRPRQITYRMSWFERHGSVRWMLELVV